jgi:hypothetical protein
MHYILGQYNRPSKRIHIDVLRGIPKMQEEFVSCNDGEKKHMQYQI